MNKHWSNALARMGACSRAVTWAATQPSRRAAWEACERGDWMLWVSGRTPGCDRKALVLAACACARLALAHVPAGETRPMHAIATAEAWARSAPGVTLEDVRRAAYAAANAAANAANAANAAANAAYAANAANAAARDVSLKASADICRRMLPMPTIELRKKS